MKSLLVIIALFLAAPASVGERHQEQAGGFSFCPPAGWEAREVPGQKYKVHVGPASGGLSPNVIVKDVPFEGTLEQFVSRNMLMFTKLSEEGKVKGYRALPGSELKTASGAWALRSAIEIEINGRPLRQTFYSFDAAGRKIYLCFTAPAAGADEYDKTFDESAETFRLEGPPAPPAQ